MSHRRIAIVASVVVAAVLAVVFWVLGSTPEAPGDAARGPAPQAEPNAVATPPTPRPADTAAAPSPMPRVIVAGQQTLDLRVVVDVSHDGEVNPMEGRVVIAATLDLAPTGEPTTDGSTWLGGRLRAPRVVADAALIGPMRLIAGAPETGFERPFLLRVSDADGVVERRFDAAMPRGAQSALATITGALQIAGSGPRDAAWTTIEDHGDGATPTRYEPVADGLVKRWRREQGKSPFMDDAGPAPVVHTGLVRWTRDAAGRVSAAGDTLLVADLSVTTTNEGRYTSHVHLDATTLSPPTDDDWARVLRSHDLAFAQPERSAAQAKPATPDVRFAASTPSELVQASREASEAGDWKTRRAATRALIARLKVDPAAVADVGERLREDLASDSDLQTLVDALLSVETPAAQALVASLLTNRTAPSMNRHVLAIGTTFSRSPETVLAALTRASEDAGRDPAATAALLALAGQARLRADDEPEVAAALTSAITDRAHQILTTTPMADRVNNPGDLLPHGVPIGVLIAWLDALGNVGGQEVEALVTPWFDLREPRVRRAAADALRFVPTVSARLRLSKLMLDDDDADVRQTAVKATAYHPSAPFQEVVVRVLENDRDTKVRLAAAASIARWAYEAPLLYDHLRAAVKREADPAMKDIMRQLLPVQLENGHEVTP